MGPYSEELQQKRSNNLKKLIADTNISDDMKRIWKQHLNNLAVNEDEYNKRVRKIYAKIHPWNIVK
jgi:hypothetical protein